MKKMSKLWVYLTLMLFIVPAIIGAQTTRKALGGKPGLGSDCFIIVDTIFHFSPDLSVQGKIYYKEFSQRYKIKQEGIETFFPIKNILFACDTILGGVSAINISSSNRWHTMYGGTQIFGDSTEIKELAGSGTGDGFYYIYFCPTEQPCFSIRVKMNQKEKLLTEVKNLYILWNEVGTGIYNK